MTLDEAPFDDRPEAGLTGASPDMAAPAAIALRDATERLCAIRNPASVSIRDIADEAGLSPGLVYHYYESREHLFGATLLAMARDMVDPVGPSDREPSDSAAPDSAIAMTRGVLDVMHERPAFARMVTVLYLDGYDVSELMGRHPLIEALVASRGSDTEARVLAAAAVGILLSAGIYSDGLLDAVGAPGETDALRAAQARTLAWLFDQTDPGP